MEEQSLSWDRAAFRAIVLSALAGALAVFLSVTCLSSYGWSVFLVLPFAQAAFAAFLVRRAVPCSRAKSYLVAILSIGLLGVMIICLRLDGAICLLMALPLAAVIALPGALLGHALGEHSANGPSGLIPLGILLIFPAFQGFEYLHPPEPPVRQVTSRVTIHAPIETVWEEVIAFDRITKPPEGIFRLGIAYPIQAHIYGQGVGAVRHCIFSTGPFVEPITTWDPPHRLEFDVTSNPPPLNEMSPYGHIDVPHLHGTFVSRHGRFRLWEENGQVVLEGTTWYYQRISPDWYWHLLSDAIIHQIHLRVLEQIKTQAEKA